MGDYPGLFKWALKVTTRVLVRRRQGQKQEMGQQRQRLDGCTFEDGGGATSQGTQAASGRWKRQENRFFL